MNEQGESRKAFHFDLSTKKLMEHYPSAKKFGWRKAWSDIRSFMEDHGFEHAQFSGYESVEPMGYDKAYAIMKTSLDKGTQRKTTENELPSLTQCTA